MNAEFALLTWCCPFWILKCLFLTVSNVSSLLGITIDKKYFSKFTLNVYVQCMYEEVLVLHLASSSVYGRCS